MKTVVLAFTAFLSVANAADKVCFYAGGSYGYKGDYFLAQVTTKKMVTKNVKGENAWEGTFENPKGATVKGKDGKTYLDFYADGYEGCNTILVDQALTLKGGMGLIKFQCRGEGFNQEKYFCRDNK
jgi:hypothetical protein